MSRITFSDFANRQVAQVTGDNLSEVAAAVSAGKLNRVSLRHLSGAPRDALHRLTAQGRLDEVVVTDPEKFDLSPLERPPGLECLTVGESKTRLRVCSERLAELRVESPESIELLGKNKIQVLDASDATPTTLRSLLSAEVRELSLVGFKGKELATGELANLRMLSVSLSRSIELLPEPAPLVQRISFERCSNIDLAELPVLGSLAEVELIDCGEQSSLDWIFRLPALKSLNFYGTRIQGGNLEPLLEANGLVAVNFRDRRDQSHTLAEVRGHLRRRENRDS